MHFEDSHYFQLNLECLKKHHPHLYQMAVSGKIEPEGEIQAAPNGKPNLKVQAPNGNSMYLHDVTDPETEAGDYLKRVSPEDTGVVLFLGMGLGYGPMAMVRQRPQIQHIVVFELCPGIFIQALHVMDLRPLLMDTRVAIHVGQTLDVEKALLPAECSLQLENVHILKQSRAIHLRTDAYQILHDHIYNHANTLNISGTTTRKFGPQMFTNRFQNLATIHHHLLFDSLKGAFRGIPAVLIAGGPSLERDLHLLPLLKERAVIIAVDTVLPVLLKNGVVPDFMTTIDPQPMVFEKIADILPEVPPGIHLISAISGFPKVSKTFPASQVYWVFAAKFFESWFNRLLGGKLLTAGAGTVAHLNLLAAVFMECSPIVFIGQDLAHSRDKSHVSGVALSSPNRTQKILEDTQNLQWVKGVDGHSVPTDRGFMDMKHYFERIISEHPGHYINATHRGVHIEGTEVLALTETLKCHALQRHDISGRLNALAHQRLQYDEDRFVQTFVDLIAEMEDTQKKISKYENLITKGKKQIRKLARARQRARTFNELPPSTQKMIQKIDALSDATDKASTIWELVQELTMDGLRESERQKREIDQLVNDPARYLQWLSKNLERLGYVNGVHKNTIDLLYSNITEMLDFYQKEQGFLESIDRTEEDNKKLEVLTALADLYIAFENYQLAKPVLEKNLRVQPDNADIYFKLGVVALHQANHDLAETDFQKAVEIDPQIQLKIQDVRQKFGDIYLGYIKRGDLRVRKKMLIKGLRYCNDHDGIITWMNQWASKALDNIAIKDDAGDIEKVKRAIDFWEDIADWDPVILALDLQSKAYVYAAKLALTRGDLEKAGTKLKVALEKAPDHLESLQTMTEICFAAGKFEAGIHYLQHAIQLDAKCAVLWERIGDRLLAKEQPANAVSAYEQCFLHFPEKLELLKKIGECYLAIGNYDAARQALQFFRDRQAG